MVSLASDISHVSGPLTGIRPYMHQADHFGLNFHQ
jgi:hypothetical protein